MRNNNARLTVGMLTFSFITFILFFSPNVISATKSAVPISRPLPSSQKPGPTLPKLSQTKLNDVKVTNKIDATVLKRVYDNMRSSGGYCLENDGGKNPSKKGNIYYWWINPAANKYELTSKVDKCKDDKFVSEFSCTNWMMNSANTEASMQKTIACAANEICQDGACVPIPCLDSDSGDNFMVKGTVTVWENSSFKTIQDKCENQTTLLEGVCGVNKQFTENKINCCDYNMICEQGRCVLSQNSRTNLCGNIIDLCPQIDGVQTEYVFDTNYDGTVDACIPTTPLVCHDPDPSKTYPNATLYDHMGGWHLGFCTQNQGEVFHIICDESLNFTVDKTQCQYGMDCKYGACAKCYDSDGHDNFTAVGWASYINDVGALETYNDHCENGWILDAICSDSKFASQPPPQGMTCSKQQNPETGAWELVFIPFSSEMSCTDSDVGSADSFKSFGNVQGIDENGAQYSFNDFCGSQAIADWTCDGNVKKLTSKNCPDGQVCTQVNTNGTITLECIASSPLENCTDSDASSADQFSTSGYVTGYNEYGEAYTKTDTCFSNAIIDYYCVGKKYNSTYKFCDANTTCKTYMLNDVQMFACATSCFKPGDQTNDIYVAGTVYDVDNNSWPDFCEGNQLKQYSCNPVTLEKVDIPPFECPNGCLNGACVK